jgi:hypothetical protein
MVDRPARDRLAESIRQLAAGAVTNWEFEDKAEFDSLDPAIRAVFWSGPWHLYDDFGNYRLRGRDRLDPLVRREAARWVLFLKTDLAYEWPVARCNVLRAVGWVLANLVTAGQAARRARHEFEKHGDISVWPFIRRSDYETALTTPPYLGGRSTLR